jgi:methyltransferase (TIGR00027 family)
MASLIPRPVLRVLPLLRSTVSLHTARLNDFHHDEDVSHAGDRDPRSDNRSFFTDLEATAFLCALHRARETERRRPRLYDPYAQRLVEVAESAEGRTFSDTLSPPVRIHHRRWHAGIVVRTDVFDQVICRLVIDQNARLVLNLASGYDTRPYRLGIPSSVQWIEVDTSRVLYTKAAALHDVRPRCELEQMPVDLTDAEARQRLLAHIDQEQRDRECRGLVVTEGLLAYLNPEQVGALASDLHALGSLRWWILDLGSPQVAAHLVRSFRRIPAQVPHQIDRTSRPEGPLNPRPPASLPAGLATSGSAAFQLFSPDDGLAFFTKFGWRVIEEYTFLEEAHRLRAITPWVWWAYQVVCRIGTASQQDLFRHMARFVVLERTDELPTARFRCQKPTRPDVSGGATVSASL